MVRSCYTNGMIPILRSTKFVLRPFQKSDEMTLVKHINDREISRNTLNIPYPYSRRDARKWITRVLRAYRRKPPEQISWVIAINGELAGAIDLAHIRQGHKAEIGYWLGRQYWGQGIMTKAVRLVIKYGFRRFKLKRIYAFTFPWNKGSQGVLVKTGFKREGLLEKNAKKGNRIFDSILFAKVR